MIVDSSALPEQVTVDVLSSAFGSAGQRCSALRVLFVQDDVADQMIEMITGAMAELKLGDPVLLSTDVGPVIDQDSAEVLHAHIVQMKRCSRALWSLPVPPECHHGNFVAPHIFEIDGIHQLDREVFGPILHVVRFARNQLDQVLDDINATGYGLTLGIHSRIDETIDYITARLAVGNTYINRGMTGAVVGVQPFGGEGLSGTGPKAGGPLTLHRYATERTVTINTAAAGGNASLIAGLEDQS
jgi:RHH-type proline utilization regulon transcriptional repressor/proline dehydrogenase/delta 1-pyrroline-5-carboxylate dehydrogenase